MIHTSKIQMEKLEYWFDDSITKYVPNSRQRIIVDSEHLYLKSENKYDFRTTMTVIFFSKMPKDIPSFCRIQTLSHLIFENKGTANQMTIESIILLLKQQYQFSINIFRQENMGEFTLPCHIDKNKIDEKIFEHLNEKYKDEIFFHHQFDVAGLYTWYA